MKTVEQMVREFSEKYGHLINEKPTVEVSPVVKDLRIKLIEEEFLELSDALLNDNLSDIADGCADLVYVIVGTCLSYGIPFDRVFAEVHNSNMTKTSFKVTDPTHGHKYGAGNPKGPGYISPQVRAILESPEIKTELERNDRA